MPVKRARWLYCRVPEAAIQQDPVMPIGAGPQYPGRSAQRMRAIASRASQATAKCLPTFMAQYGHQRIYFAYLHRDPRSLPLEGGHTWIRRSRQVIVDGGPLMFSSAGTRGGGRRSWTATASLKCVLARSAGVRTRPLQARSFRAHSAGVSTRPLPALPNAALWQLSAAQQWLATSRRATLRFFVILATFNLRRRRCLGVSTGANITGPSHISIEAELKLPQ